MPRGHWPFCSLWTLVTDPLSTQDPHLPLGILFTCVVGDAGPLAARRGAEDFVAVHEEAFIVFPALRVHDGDVGDDGDCRGGRVSQSPRLGLLRPLSTPYLPVPHSLDMGRLGWVARLMMASRSGPQPAPLRAFTV